ncbi:MAG: hypothetical protein Q4E55_02745 [Bacteroidales bacterium]|nr:hypothetical protein [Bacteroidales bacterium]
MKKIGKGILWIAVLVLAFYYFKDKAETNWGCSSSHSVEQRELPQGLPPQQGVPQTGAGGNVMPWDIPSSNDSYVDAGKYQRDYDLKEGFVRDICSSLEVMSNGVSRTIMLSDFTKYQVEMRQIRREAAANGVQIFESPYENMPAPESRY